MSWHYLQGQEAASWEESSLDGAPSALSKLVPTPGACCLQDKPMGALTDSQYGMTSRLLTDANGVEQLMWYQGDSPVKTYLRQEKEEELKENDLDCGPKCHESLAKYSRASRSWKTAQCSLFGGLTEFSGIWPRWGMMQDGELSVLKMQERHTQENGFGWLPTPRASMWKNRKWWNCFYKKEPKGNLEELPVFMPTQFSHLAGKPINPEWLEWVMGWPVGWSDQSALETDRFRQWQNWHGKH
jgi:hypothetical protein